MRTTEFASAQIGEPAELAPDPASRHLNQPPLPTGRCSGRTYRTRKGLPEPISLYSRMGHYAVLLGSSYMRKNGEKRPMVRCGCSTPRGSAIVAHVRYANSVKNRQPLSRRDGSAPSASLSTGADFKCVPTCPRGPFTSIGFSLVQCILVMLRVVLLQECSFFIWMKERSRVCFSFVSGECIFHDSLLVFKSSPFHIP